MTFGVMYDHTFSKFANHQIRRQATDKWAVSLVIAYGHFNVPPGIFWLTYSLDLPRGLGTIWTHILTILSVTKTYLVSHCSVAAFIHPTTCEVRHLTESQVYMVTRLNMPRKRPGTDHRYPGVVVAIFRGGPSFWPRHWNVYAIMY